MINIILKNIKLLFNYLFNYELNDTNSKRIILYYQTLVDLQPLINLIQNKKKNSYPMLTHITLASIHFGYNEDKTPYIHLNNNSAFSPKYDSVFKNLNTLKELNVEVNLLIGGAGTAFNKLFSDYDVFYPLLNKFIADKDIFDGINLDIEEGTTIDNLVKLVTDLIHDFPKLKITFAPLAYSITSNEPGMGGFSYQKLLEKLPIIPEYMNVQCYGEYSLELFEDMIKNDYSPKSIVMGMLVGQDFDSIQTELTRITNKYNQSFGGVAVWEYFNAPPQGESKPYEWCVTMNKLLYNNNQKE